MKWYEQKVVTVLGKSAVEGIDKHTQEPKTNCIIYYSYFDEKVEGVAVESRWVGDYCCPENQITIGEQYEMEVARNYVTKFEHIPSKKDESRRYKLKRKERRNGKASNNFGSLQQA